MTTVLAKLTRLSVMTLVACGGDLGDGEDGCAVDGYESLEADGFVDFFYNGLPRRSCYSSVVGEVVGASGTAQREDGLGWHVSVGSDGGLCTGGSECVLTYTIVQDTTPICIYAADSDATSSVGGTVIVTVDEYGDGFVSGTFSGELVRADGPFGEGCEGDDAVITEGIFESYQFL